MLTQLQNPSLNHPVSYSKGYKLIVSLVFVLSISLYSVFSSDSAFQHISLIVAAMLGGYMAMTIGANDIANTMGPAVGSNAVSMPVAISIAIVFELMGAIFAGGEVVSTIKSQIINVELIDDTQRFVWLMLAALAAAGIWLNVATAAKAPVSTTQAIVGSIVGAAIAAEGLALVDWSTLITITFAWLLSPVLGGALAAWLVYIMTATIIDKENKLLAAKRWVPIYVALMVWAFLTYLLGKFSALFLPETSPIYSAFAIKNLSFLWIVLLSALLAVVVFLLVKLALNLAMTKVNNDEISVNRLFNLPLVFAAALMSFAHGANDVANVVAPVTAIYEALTHGQLVQQAQVPIWAPILAAIGIGLGLILFGPRLIRVVGSEITRLNQLSGFAVLFSVALVVIVASQLGLPVSSTYIAIGGVFGVGLLKEWQAQQAHLLDRHTMKKVITAWLITLPSTGVLAAIVFYNIQYFLG